MPIKVDDIKKLDEELCFVSTRSNLDMVTITVFLQKNKEKAFTQKEILNGINLELELEQKKITKNSIYIAMQILNETNLIQNKGSYYWYEKKEE